MGISVAKLCRKCLCSATDFCDKCKLKHFRRVATRSDKLAKNFLATAQLASMRLWLRACNSTSWCRQASRGTAFIRLLAHRPAPCSVAPCWT